MNIPIFKDNDKLNTEFYTLLERATTTKNYAEQRKVVVDINNTLNNNSGYSKRFVEIFKPRLEQWISEKKIELTGTNEDVHHFDLIGTERISEWIEEWKIHRSNSLLYFSKWKYNNDSVWKDDPTGLYKTFKELYADAWNNCYHNEVYVPKEMYASNDGRFTQRLYEEGCTKLRAKYEKGYKEYIKKKFPNDNEPFEYYLTRSEFTNYMHVVKADASTEAAEQKRKEKAIERQSREQQNNEKNKVNDIIRGDVKAVALVFSYLNINSDNLSLDDLELSYGIAANTISKLSYWLDLFNFSGENHRINPIFPHSKGRTPTAKQMTYYTQSFDKAVKYLKAKGATKEAINAEQEFLEISVEA